MIITLLLFFFFLSYTNQGVIGTGYFCSSRFSDEVCSTVAELVTCTRILWQKTKVCNRCYLNTALYFSLLFFLKNPYGCHMVRCLLVSSIKSRMYLTENRVYRKRGFSFFFSKLTSQPDAYLLGEKWLVLAKFSLTHMPFIVG